MLHVEVKSSGTGPSFKTRQPVESSSVVRIMEYFTVGLVLLGDARGVAVIIRRAA